MTGDSQGRRRWLERRDHETHNGCSPATKGHHHGHALLECQHVRAGTRIAGIRPAGRRLGGAGRRLRWRARERSGSAPWCAAIRGGQPSPTTSWSKTPWSWNSASRATRCGTRADHGAGLPTAVAARHGCHRALRSIAVDCSESGQLARRDDGTHRRPRAPAAGNRRTAEPASTVAVVETPIVAGGEPRHLLALPAHRPI